jgi:hypothetical protein
MAREPGSIGVRAVAMPAGPRLQVGTVREVGAVRQVGTVRPARTHDTNNVGSGPLTIRPKPDPHHATEA